MAPRHAVDTLLSACYRALILIGGPEARTALAR